MIIALMETQVSYINDERLRTAIEDTQNRIYSMSLVHEKMYQSGDLSHINLAEYAQELVLWLLDSFELDSRQIGIQYDIKDVNISIETAIPCGLILQELITNVFKHAFPSGERGNMIIKIERAEDDSINLVVDDDGAGVPPSMNIREDGKLGISTIIALAEMQLRGKMQFDTAKGLKVSINFRDDFQVSGKVEQVAEK